MASKEYGEIRRVDQQKSQIQNKNEDNERVRRNPLRDLPEWLEKYTENLVDESVPEYRDAPAISFVSQLQIREEKLFRASTIYIYIYIYILFPKDQNCDICLRNKINKGSLQKTHWYSRASSGTIR